MAVFTVANLNDAGDGSLRQAILDANAAAGADEIEFDAAAVGTINLISGELTITDNLTINGPGADLLSIDANRQSRVFNIDDGRDEMQLDVELTGLTITGGRNSTAIDEIVAGGGIFTRENLTLIDSSVVDNALFFNALIDETFGGGIYVAGADLSLIRSTISGNTADVGNDEAYGGGVALVHSGTLTITDSTITGNTSDGSGGGIYVGDGGGLYRDRIRRVIINGSTISGNTASDGGGGGIYAERSDLTVIDSTISENVAGGAGGISFHDGRMILADSVVKDNKAVEQESSGGGLHLRGAHVTVTRSTISGNTTDDESGGGIKSKNTDLTVIDSTISGNTAGRDGGGIYSVYSDLTVINSTISGNTANNKGGGIYAHASDGVDRTVNITDSTISGNTAGLGGGIYALSEFGVELALTVTGSIVSGNSAGDSPDVFGTVASSHSLIGGPDPQLAPLADNGGPTQTHALLPGSPAIDAGDPEFMSPPQFDQRGSPFARVVNGRIDIGAYEFSPPPADLTGNGFVDFEDLTILLANWNQNVSAAQGNLVEADTTPVNFADLTVLLANWTSPGPAASPQPAATEAIVQHHTPTIESHTATSTRFDQLTRRTHTPLRRIDPSTKLSPHDSPLRRLQAVAVDRAMEEDSESTLVRRRLAFVRRRR